MKYVNTHRGFIVPGQVVNHDPNIEWYSAPALEQLAKQLMMPTAPVLSWEWRRDALMLIKPLFDHSSNFFALQLGSHAPVAPRALDFLYSTLNFIQTGKRAVSVHTWMELLQFDPIVTPVSHKVQADFRDAFRELLIVPNSKIMARWLQHPMGLQDLILSALIIFGPLPAGYKSET